MATIDSGLSVSQPLPTFDDNLGLANAALAGTAKTTGTSKAPRLSKGTSTALPPMAGTSVLEPTTVQKRREAGQEAYERKIDALGAKATISPVYLDALKSAAGIPTVSFGARGSPRPYQLRPIETPPGYAPGTGEWVERSVSAPPESRYKREPMLMRDESLPPPPRGLLGSRNGLKHFKAQRRKEGKAANESPGRNELSVHPAFREEFPRIADAADGFNLRHRVRTRTTNALLTCLEHDTTSSRMFNRFGVGLEEVRRNRFFLGDASFGIGSGVGMGGGAGDAEKAQRLAAGRARLRRAGAKWNPDTSVWLPRKLKGNSRDYYETDEAIARMLAADLNLAMMARKGFIQKLIVQHDDGGEGNDDDGDGIEDEVEDVQEVIGSHARMLYNAFDYYSCNDVSAANSKGIDAEHEIHDMSLSGLLAMARDCKLASAQCPNRVFELIFAQVDAKDEATAHLDRFNRVRALDRQEFLQAIVRMALERYVKTKEVLDVSDAVEKLCRKIADTLPEPAKHDPNVFRERYCYLRQVDKMLRKHLNTLQNLFTRYADLSEGQGDAQVELLDSASMMSIREWMALIDHLGFFDSTQLSFYEAKQIFSWARIRSLKDNSQASLVRLRNLTFEDFMEAMVRLSMVVALPTDNDLSALGVADAGEYLLSLAAESPALYRSFLSERKGNWFGPPRQHIWCCVDHLLTYCSRLIELNSRGDKDMTVSAQEVKQFARMRSKGTGLVYKAKEQEGKTQPAPSGEPGKLRKGKSHAAAMRAVSEKLLGSLRGNNQLSAWGDGKLKKLLGSMSNASFEESDFVYNQGDEADQLYFVVSGSADVLRENEATGELDVIKTLGQGAIFGESELVKGGMRAESVKATSALRTLCITRAAYESSIGRLEGAFEVEAVHARDDASSKDPIPSTA